MKKWNWGAFFEGVGLACLVRLVVEIICLIAKR